MKVLSFFSYLLLTGFVFPLTAQTKTVPAQREILKIPDWPVPSFKDQVFNILTYGAKQNDIPGNTNALKKAVEDCHKSGGGTVLVPKGIWITGPIHLKSNVNLHLAEGAELRFSQNYVDYLPAVLIQRAGLLCYNYSPFIYAHKQTNIAVTGKGTLNGQGQVWWPWKNKQPGMVELFTMGKSRVPVEKRVFATEAAGVRPPFIQFLECRDILIEGVTLLDGPSWNVHPVFCENVTIRAIYIKSHGPNNDGIDPDGCKNVLIEDCTIDVGDDNICLKSGRDEEAWEIGRPLENVIVRRCTTIAGHGGFVIGSEMSAGVRNVIVEDCHFAGTQRGIRFKSRLGRGGVVENIYIRNITMDSIRNEAVIFDLQYDGEPIEKALNYNSNHTKRADAPIFQNISIENISCLYADKAIFLRGLPGGDYLRDISLTNIRVRAKSGISCDFVQGLSLQDIQVIPIVNGK